MKKANDTRNSVIKNIKIPDSTNKGRILQARQNEYTQDQKNNIAKLEKLWETQTKNQDKFITIN